MKMKIRRWWWSLDAISMNNDEDRNILLNSKMWKIKFIGVQMFKSGVKKN